MNLAELLKEKKKRQKSRAESRPGSEKNWQEFRGLNDEAIIEKLGTLSADSMLDIYKKLEKESGFRRDPANYTLHRIRNCFMILWRRKLQDEERKAKAGTPLVPLTEAELDRIWSTDPPGPLKLSDPPTRLS